MSQTEILAYCAGFFDGEGTVTITTEKTKVKTGRRNHRVQINASQKEIRPLLLFKSTFGGSVRLITKRGIRSCYTWWICGREKQLLFLETIIPFLLIKRTEAKIAKQFLGTVRERNVRGRIGQIARTEDSVYELRERLYTQSMSVRRRKSLMEDSAGQYEFPVSSVLIGHN